MLHIDDVVVRILRIQFKRYRASVKRRARWVEFGGDEVERRVREINATRYVTAVQPLLIPLDLSHYQCYNGFQYVQSHCRQLSNSLQN